jgi:hypothetical protein
LDKAILSYLHNQPIIMDTKFSYCFEIGYCILQDLA